MQDLQLIIVQSPEETRHVTSLQCEYFTWTNLMFTREYNISFDVNAFVSDELANISQFQPPYGRLLLAECENQIAGCACLRKLDEDIGELKRMYVRPEYRRRGIGKFLIEGIIKEASLIGYTKLRLDTAPFTKEAQDFYRSLGFQCIPPYFEKSDVPEYIRASWVFMELVL